MTTAKPVASASPARSRLPDIPQRHPDEKMTSSKHLSVTGSAHHLIQHLGNPLTTLVSGDRWIIATPGTYAELARYPDLLVAFDVDPAAYEASNGYIISEQGKPPDFVLEVASESTGHRDVVDKREKYAIFEISEYWRFDETGEYHGTRLAGDRLVNGAYAPIDIDELPDGSLQGYSAALNLYLRWQDGQLLWIDPATGEHIATFDSERNRADRERNRADTAEARIRELEERLRLSEG